VVGIIDEPEQDWAAPIREHLRVGNPFQTRTFVAYTAGHWRAEVTFAGMNDELAITISRAETSDPASAFAGACAAAETILSRLLRSAQRPGDDEPRTA
jgi:hypothetical protein